ncbi:hypothetical protein HME9304_00029 [Flagellimonas maritima]|uniref:SH3b domain-containing protein n=1 Tax=Flagellimonas maritima TaxID=1383885 RepID=A0A2Z4LML0_9FLAO|nr:SH3 domain-containing protein [Allomuricauda aurantiaca]AWX43042.1 hypothetical protein HME9304_00029 [Allomuricauda aurantiaca]
MNINFRLLLIVIFFTLFKNKGTSQDRNWQDFLSHFPSTNEILKIPSHNDLIKTISTDILSKYLWSDSTKVMTPRGKEKKRVYVPNSILKGKEFVYPLGYKPSRILMVSGLSKSGKECDFKGNVYPLYQIKIDDNLLIGYSYFDPAEGLLITTLIVLNKSFQMIGHFGFAYGVNWQYCDNTLEEILEETKPYSAPVKILDNGFLLHDQMVGSYYENTLNDQYWKVIIREDGKFEIVEERKNYEDGTVTLWSKYGYHVSDPDGYTNLRESPSTSSEIISQVKNDAMLEILDANSDWWKVRTLEGREGYMHKSRIVKGDGE